MKKKLSEIVKQFFNTDISYIANSGGWLAISQILSVILNIILAAAFANLLSQETYGTYKYFISLIGLFSIFSLPGMKIAVTRTVSRGTETNIYNGLKMKIKWGFIGSAAAIITAIFYFTKSNEYFGWTLLAISLTIPFFGSLGIFQAYLSGKREFKAVAKNSALIKLAFTSLLIITLFFFQEIWILVLVYILYTIFLNGLSLYFTLKKFPPKDSEVDRDLSDGKHLSIMSGLGVVTGTLHSIALWHFIGPVGLAVYALAIAPVEQIRPFIKFSEGIFLPKLSQNSWQIGNFRWFIKKITPFALIITVGIIFYILVAPFLYSILFPSYLESTLYSQIFATSIIFTALGIVTNAILKAKKNVSAMYVLSTADILMDVFLVIPSVFYFGILGLVISITVKKSITLIISLLLLFRISLVRHVEKFFLV